MVRIAREDVELPSGGTIGRGDRVFLMINAANRDPRALRRTGPRRTSGATRTASRVWLRPPLLSRRAAGPARGPDRHSGAAPTPARPDAHDRRAPVARLAGLSRSAVAPADVSSRVVRATQWACRIPTASGRGPSWRQYEVLPRLDDALVAGGRSPRVRITIRRSGAGQFRRDATAAMRGHRRAREEGP